MEKVTLTERFKRMKKYFRRTSKEELVFLLNRAIKELSEIERRADEIWSHANNGMKGRKSKVYLELIGEEVDKIYENVENIKSILNQAKDNVRISHRKEYQIELWI